MELKPFEKWLKEEGVRGRRREEAFEQAKAKLAEGPFTIVEGARANGGYDLFRRWLETLGLKLPTLLFEAQVVPLEPKPPSRTPPPIDAIKALAAAGAVASQLEGLCQSAITSFEGSTEIVLELPANRKQPAKVIALKRVPAGVLDATTLDAVKALVLHSNGRPEIDPARPLIAREPGGPGASLRMIRYAIGKA